MTDKKEENCEKKSEDKGKLFNLILLSSIQQRESSLMKMIHGKDDFSSCVLCDTKATLLVN